MTMWFEAAKGLGTAPDRSTAPTGAAVRSPPPPAADPDGTERSAPWRFLAGLAKPVSDGKRRLLDRRRRELPEGLRGDLQVVGRQLVHCGYTLGAPYCSFGCTHCYLPSNANRVPLPSLDEMKRQIDANRGALGADGALQITGGDVVDAYFKDDRADELVEIVRYATGVGLVPMLMTHGQRLLDHPDYLERLVRVGRLRKLAVHVDVTQAGRPGYPIRSLRRESDLHPLRERFVELILDVRRRTGVSLSAAHTLTVTERNRDSVGDVLGWLTAEPRRLRAFRMISLQPEAAVGRTRFSTHPVTPEATWRSVCAALGVSLGRDNVRFGHPDCSSMATVLVRYRDRRVVDAMPSDPASRRFRARLLEVFGGIGSRGHDRARANGQRLGLCLRHPGIVVEAARWALGRLRAERLGPGFLIDLARGRVGALNVVLHNFMSDEELRSGGETVRQRLAACSFRGMVERGGDWVAVPMCSMNVEEREGLYRDRIETARGAARERLPVVC